MKLFLFSTGIVIACLLYSCGKSGAPSPSGNGSGNNGGSTGPVTVGNTVTANGYVTKTIGISRIKLATDENFKITVAELFGGGNRVILKAGTGFKMQYSDVHSANPKIDDTPDDLPNAYLWSLAQPIDNGKVLDTTGITIKLTGFDKSKTGYNQLNLVVCDDVHYITTNGIVWYNLMYMDIKAEKAASDYKFEFFRQLFTSDINVSSVEMAKPLSEKPYIVRDVTMDGAIITASKSDINNITALSFYYNGLGMLKLLQTTNNPINVGGPLNSEIVNADKGTLSYTPFPDIYSPNTYFDPVFSNIKTGGFDQIVEPADTTSKVFIRVSGFDASICGFNQLRLFLTHTPNSLLPEQLQYYNELLKSQLTLDYIKHSLQNSNAKCIQLVVM